MNLRLLPPAGKPLAWEGRESRDAVGAARSCDRIVAVMRVINRTAITVVGTQPYIDWTLRKEADANKGKLTVARARTFGTVYLTPEFELEEDLQEWVEENVTWLFEFQLAAWTEDEASWPATRDLKTFREWFRIDIHSTVVDVAEEDIEGKEL